MMQAVSEKKWYQWAFRGPVFAPGPDFDEPLERFDPEFLRANCSANPRVAAYLARLKRVEELPLELDRIWEEIKELKARLTESKPQENSEKPQRRQPKPSYRGVAI